VAGKPVFAADFETAVSANPYIQFKFKAQESGPVVLTWTDDDGSTIVGEESITVT
jgi:sulfur-oxidizing protein SoxZ